MARIALVALAALLLAGCAGDNDRSDSSATKSSDGRQFGYVQGANQSANPPTITFDPAQSFFGEDAQRAAEKDGAVEPGEAVPNDHYERNTVMEIRVLELAPDVQVNAAPPASHLMRFVSRQARRQCESATEICTAIPLSQASFFAAMDKLGSQYGIPAWVTARDGLVVRIDEQYFP